MSGDNRQALRHRCRFRAQIRIGGRNHDGHIVDLSETGMRLLTDQVADIWTGNRVEVFSAELGWMTGIVRWRRPGGFGLRLDESSNMRAKFEAFRKNFTMA